MCLDYISLNAAGRSAANDNRLGAEQRLTPSSLVVRCGRGIKTRDTAAGRHAAGTTRFVVEVRMFSFE